MTPSELKAARRKLGFSTAGLARALAMGAHGGRTVRRWEAGEHPIPGMARIAIGLMLDGHISCVKSHSGPTRESA